MQFNEKYVLLEEGRMYWVMYMGKPVQRRLLSIKERDDRKDIVNLNFDLLATDSSQVYETKEALLQSL